MTRNRVKKQITRLPVGLLLLSLLFVLAYDTLAAPTVSILGGGIAINEILIDPNGTNNFDTDGNGTADTPDEFVEIYNLSGAAIDISGFELWDDGTNHWYTFPDSTMLGAGNYAVVVCGVQTGGSLPAVSGGNLAFDAGRASGVINNGDDNVVLYDPDTDEYIQLLYNGAAADNPPVDYAGFSATATRVGSVENWGSDSDGISLVREPAGDTNIVIHNTVSSNNASPGGASNIPGDSTPSVANTTPGNGDTNVAVDANITIGFSEDVTVSGSWFEINCTSGIHTAAVSGGPQSFTLDPDDNFAEGETCTVTISATQVADQDGDPDNMTNDYVFSFNTESTTSGPSLIITEIMYDPNSSEDDWEWIEIYNSGSDTVDLTGFVIDDSNNVSHSEANIAGGSLAPGESAVLYNVDDVADTDFAAAWGTVNLIPVTNWSAMSLNNSGDKVSLWTDFASYSGDHVTHANAIDTVDYDGAGFPDPVGASIYLTDLNVGSNWRTSAIDEVTPLFTGYQSLAVAGNVGTDVGSPGIPPAPPANQLLLTEIVVTPTGGEFIEIYNPTGSDIDLSNVYLTDATYAGGSTYYYNIVMGSNAGGGGFGDFHARFPDGASIPAGAYQTIALNGSDNFTNEYGVAPTYELYEDGSAADGVPDMREALTDSILSQGGLTNDGEVVILYYWDGSSDLVTDLDYAVWGDKAEAVDKTGVSIDGPDTDSDTSSYLNDTTIASQDVVAGGAHEFGNSWQREDFAEGAEIATGGNGVDGNDETSEDLSNTWCEGSPTPGAENVCSGGEPELGLCGEPAILIHDVQGNGSTSPLVGTSVIIEGVVVGDFQNNSELDSGDLNGFYVQEEDGEADANPETSEGILVYAPSAADVKVGDHVRVAGDVQEYSTSSGASLMTELNASDMLICDTPALMPLSTEVTLPVSDITDFERYEGMLVTFTQDLVISEYFNFDRFGEIVLALPAAGQNRSHQPTAIFEPSSTEAADLATLNALSRITLDDGQPSQNSDPAIHPNGNVFDLTNTFRGGDIVQGATGVVDETFGLYRIQPTAGANYTSTNPRTEEPDDVGGSLKVSNFNVLNYFLTLDNGVDDICGPLKNKECRGADDTNEFERQQAKILSALVAIDADIFGLIELENTADVEPLQDIIDGLNEQLGAGTYTFINTGTIGGDAIKVGLIYKPASVTPLGNFEILDSTDDPRFNDTKSRPVLAQTFQENATGGIVTVAVNHLKSKGSACGEGDDDPEQGSCNVTRTLAAQALVDWLAIDPTNSGDPDFLIMGDLNSYDKEDPIDAILAGADDTLDSGDDYTDLIALFQGEFAYSYVFNGQVGYLDHGLANSSLTPQVTGVTEWHINSDEPDILDYDTSYKQDAQDALYESNPFRASDHDPVIIGLNLVPQCNGANASVYVNADKKIVGGPRDGKRYWGFLIGTQDDDVIVGTDGRDMIMGLKGNDVICGLDGRDMLSGHKGNDVLFGGAGKDRLKGDQGDDTLDGGDDRDLCHGGSGTDSAVDCEFSLRIP